MKVGDFFIALGFDVDDQKLRQFDGQLTNVKNSLFGAKEYALAAMYAIGRFTGSAAQGAADMGSFADQTGLSADELQKWQNVASQLNRNLNAEAVTASIRNLARNINQIQKFGQGDTLPFRAFGIDAMDTDAFDTLRRIRETIGNYDRPTAVSLLERLGLDPNFISLLDVSNDEFERLAQNMALTADQVSALDDLGQTFGSVTVELKKFKGEMSAEFAPAIIGTIDEIRERVHSLGEDFAYLTQPWIKQALIGLGAVFAAWAAPITLTVAAIGGLIFALQELGRFLNGKENAFDKLNAWIESKLGWQKAAEGFFEPGNPNNFLNRLNRAAAEAQAENDRLTTSPPPGAGTPGQAKQGNQNTQENNINIDVHTTQDPLAVGNSIYGTISTSIKQLNNGYAN